MAPPKKAKADHLWPVAARPELRIISVRGRWILGMEERAIQPDGRSVIVRGPNNTGKTSLVEAVRAALGGGPLVNIQKVGPDKQPLGVPELGVVLEGPGGHYRIEKKGAGTASVFKRVGDTAAEEEIGTPQAWLTSLYDPACANPVTLLLAPEKELATLILEALDLDLDEPGLNAIMEKISDLVEHPKIPEGLHALLHVEMVRDAVFKTRTGVNVNEEGKRKAAQQTLLQTPAVIPEDPAEAIAQGEASVSKLAEEIAAEETAVAAEERRALEAAQAEDDLEAGKVTSAFRQAKAAMETAHAREVAELRADLERAIAELKARTEAEIAQRRGAMETAINGLREGDQAKLDELEAKHRAADEAARSARVNAGAALASKRQALADGRVQLAHLRATSDARIAAVRTHALATQFSNEAAALKLDSERLTAALDAIDVFRRGLARSLPVEGLEIADRAVTINGVPWKQLNHGQRVRAAAMIALARAEKNPLKALFLDNLESLDTPHRTALLEYLTANGAQVFGAQVTDGEAEVVYIGVQQNAEAVSA